MVAGLLLSACAPESNGPRTVTFTEEAVANAKSFNDLGILPDTAIAGMPSTGTANYAGGTELRFFSAAGEQFVLIGDTSVAVDFQSGTLSGTVAGLHGGIAPTGSVYPLTAADYTGSLVLSNGQIGSAGPNSFGALYGGTLTGAGNLITANGGLLGNFKGTPVQGIVAVGGGLVTLNGGATSGAILNLWAQ